MLFGTGERDVVQEVRSILFTAEESRTAVANFLVSRTRGLRVEQVLRVDWSSPAAALVTLRLASGNATRRLDTAELMTAVLLFCQRARIPLSTRSHKRLGLIGGKLALTTSINLQTVPPQVVDGAVMHMPAGPDLAISHTA